MDKYMFGHDVLHIVTAVVAICLFALSLLAYVRSRRWKLLFICAAFFLFACKESLLAFGFGISSDLQHWIAHSMNLVVLVLFAVGILQ